MEQRLNDHIPTMINEPKHVATARVAYEAAKAAYTKALARELILQAVRSLFGPGGTERHQSTRVPRLHIAQAQTERYSSTLAGYRSSANEPASRRRGRDRMIKSTSNRTQGEHMLNPDPDTNDRVKCCGAILLACMIGAAIWCVAICGGLALRAWWAS
jgi:hypothetical protein